MKTTPTPQRTTLVLDPELHTRLKMLAVERRTTLTDLIERALREFLERETGGRTRRTRS